jgi:hypothetical protein
MHSGFAMVTESPAQDPAYRPAHPYNMPLTCGGMQHAGQQHHEPGHEEPRKAYRTCASSPELGILSRPDRQANSVPCSGPGRAM